MNLTEMFEKYENEYLHFERVENKLSPRPDVHALILLTGLFPDDQDMICNAQHDIFYLDINCERFAEIATDEIIRELSRCGVHYEEEDESLAMFT